jgi:hypothetical protein
MQNKFKTRLTSQLTFPGSTYLKNTTIILEDQSHESVVSLWDMQTVFCRVHSIVQSAEVACEC